MAMPSRLDTLAASTLKTLTKREMLNERWNASNKAGFISRNRCMARNKDIFEVGG